MIVSTMMHLLTLVRARGSDSELIKDKTRRSVILSSRAVERERNKPITNSMRSSLQLSGWVMTAARSRMDQAHALIEEQAMAHSPCLL
jgi:hypothetical protein